jgi:hypothetical protein
MITDADREEALRIFSSLYAHPDFDMMKIHMPHFNDDPDGIMFEEYYDFLQSLYAIRADIQTVTNEEDLDFIINNIVQRSKNFSYPINILYPFIREV